MNPEILRELLIFAGVMATLGVSARLAFSAMNRRNTLPSRDETNLLLKDIAQRLARLEEAADASAIELERIAEASRFASKLLAARESRPGE